MSFQVNILDENVWTSEIMETPGTLQGWLCRMIIIPFEKHYRIFLFARTVVECYQSWCGPCKAIQSTFKRLYFDLSDRPLKFYTVGLVIHLDVENPSITTSQTAKVMQVNVDNIKALENCRGHCKPSFHLYKVKLPLPNPSMNIRDVYSEQ